MPEDITPLVTVSSSPASGAAGPQSQPGAAGRASDSRWWGPFNRWPRAASALLALFTLGVAVATAMTDLDDNPEITGRADELPILGYFILAVSSAALYWRRQKPVLVLVVGLLAVVIYEILLYPEFTDLSVLVALYSVGRYVAPHRRNHGYVAVGVTITVFGIASIIDDLPALDIWLGVFIVASTWFVGHRFRIGDERADHKDREHEARARQAVADERTHIARELHDIVAHRVSMMTVQAGAAKTVAAVDPDGAAQAMGEVERAGRQALSELRHLLNVLRTSTEADDNLGPQPGVGDIPQLVADHAETGMNITLTTDHVPSDLSGPVDLYAYRIVQESLTNSFKHAGPTAHTEVQLSADEGQLTIEVTDDGMGGPVLAGAGYGLIGMGERVSLLGGTLETRPNDRKGFTVLARLPLWQEQR